ncbi:hypothetical protein TRFO_09625 [Tritrichomonas foetus]|uniref:Importin N-terminal domain-containing protein n=1 Tax=Tritrichomonas foetus TaxID=1144522 RepID=A0A1J4JHV2_9EUKA|nr:hypothetical protein TRFO_09625 [Tritrichomonas foetus]|eukprot:OHS97077.1 hypothetical protein TRFO_09625 [Tritrichomonas foetus]
MESLTTPGVPIDIQFLDSTVLEMNANPTNNEARRALEIFSARPDAWLAANSVLNSGCSYSTKFIMLNILKNTITTFWSSFDEATKSSLIQFLFPQTVKLAQENAPINCLNKANEAIVEILKYEWPKNYPNFITDLLQSMQNSSQACMNGMLILEQLAEDIKNYIERGITASRSIEMNDAFETQFPQIFEVVQTILTNPTGLFKQNTQIFNNQSNLNKLNSDMIHSTLKAIKSFCTLVDVRFFIATPIFAVLSENFINNPEFALEVVDIFGEIATASVMPEGFSQMIPVVFKTIMQGLSTVFTDSNSFSSMTAQFIEVFATSITAYMTRFPSVIESIDEGNWARIAATWMIQVTSFAENSSFHTCFEFWMSVTRRVHNELRVKNNNAPLLLYGPSFSTLTQIILTRFVFPFEETEREDEDGVQFTEIIETTSPVYAPMKATLVFLCNMNSSEVFTALMKFLENAATQEDIYNKFVWAAACLTSPICDAFISKVFEIVSSDNILSKPRAFLWYSSQQTRFLATQPQLLHTFAERVVQMLQNDQLRPYAVFATEKLLSHEAIQKAFVNNGFVEPFIGNLASNDVIQFVSKPAAQIIVSLLNNTEKQMRKDQLLSLLLFPIDTKWKELSNDFTQNPIEIINTMRSYGQLSNVLGPHFFQYAVTLFPTFVRCYQVYTSLPVENEEGALIISRVKTSIVSTIELYAKRLPALYQTSDQLIIETSLQLVDGFVNSLPECRAPNLLRLFGLLFETCSNLIAPHLNLLFSSLFMPTVQAILGECNNLYSHRVALIDFIGGVIHGCFNFIIGFDANALNSFINTIRFLASHHQPEICQKAIRVLAEFIEAARENSPPEFANSFAQSGHSAILVVESVKLLTDTQHNFAFNELCELLAQLLKIPNTQQKLMDVAGAIQQSLFPLMPVEPNLELLVALSHAINDKFTFRQYLRDFMINTKRVGRNDPDLMRDELQIEKQRLETQLQSEMQMTCFA